MPDLRKTKLRLIGDDGPPIEEDDPGPQDCDSIVDQKSKRKAPDGDDDRMCTEIANSETFYKLHGQDFKFCYERKAWLVWADTHWSWSQAQQQIDARTTSVATAMIDMIAGNPVAPKQVLRWAQKTTSLSMRKSMADGIRPRVGVAVSDLDRDSMALNTESGIIDLQSGKVSRHKRENLATRIAPLSYKHQASAPRWEAFVDEITDGDEELADYLQRAAGYSITADMGAQIFFVCVGSGANGKSVFLRAIQRTIGDYARTVSSGIFVESLHNKRPEIAELLGVRLAIAGEPDAGKRLDEALLKSITGGDEVTAERKYEAPFVFSPVCKLWLACNTVPAFQSGGVSMGRRLVVVPFRRTFTGSDANPNLSAMLDGEREGILKWLVDGCLRWQRVGLTRPRAIVDATTEARGEMDPLSQWWGDCVTPVGGQIRTSVTDLHKSYKAWAEEAGQKPRAISSFRGLIRGRGLELVTIERRLYVVGYGLIADRVDDEEYEQMGQIETGFV